MKLIKNEDIKIDSIDDIIEHFLNNHNLDRKSPVVTFHLYELLKYKPNEDEYLFIGQGKFCFYCGNRFV